MAENAVVDTFYSAMRKGSRVSEIENPRAWLLCILKYVVKNTLRSQDTLRKHFISLEDMNEVCCEDSETDSIVQSEDFSDISFFRNAGLSDAEITLLRDYYIIGHSVRELAVLRDIPLSTCKSRLKRARDKLFHFYEGKDVNL